MPRGMGDTGYRHRLIGLLVVLLGLFARAGGLWATPQEAASPEADDAKPLALILHLSGSETDHKAALGLHLLLAERLHGIPNLRIAPRHEVLDAAEKARITRPLDHLHLRDVPYLCLKTDSQMALLGWFETDGETASLSLRAYDGVSRAYLGGGTRSQPLWKLALLLEQAGELVEAILKRKAAAPAAPDSTLNLPALHALGNAWVVAPESDSGAILAAWRSEQAESPQGPVQQQRAARLAAKTGDADELRAASLAAAQAWIAAARPDLANPLALKALAAAADGAAWTLLRPDVADASLRTKMAEALPPRAADSPDSHPVALARARLARVQDDPEAAIAYYIEASGLTEDHVDTLRETGLLAFERQEIDRAITHLQRAEKLDGVDSATRLALARVYARAQFCDRALALSTALFRSHPRNPPMALHHAEVQQTCQRPQEAIQTLTGVLAYNPEHVQALLRLEELYQAVKNEAKAKETRELIMRIDPEAHRQQEQVVEPGTGESPPPPPAPLRPRRVEVTFPVARDLMKAIPQVKVVGLVDMDRVASGPGERIGRFLLSPTRLDGRLLAEDLVALMRVQGIQVVEDGGLASRITLSAGATPFSPGSFAQAITHYQLDAVALYRLSRSEGGSVQVDFYVYERNASQVLQAQSLVMDQSNLLVFFNPGILTLPLLILLGVAGFVLWRVRQGTGSLEIAISYSSTFEDGYFAVRLSKRELDQAFNVDPLMKQPFAGTRVDTETRIRKFFASRSPLRAMARNKLTRLDKIPPGDYFVYVVGIMVNVDTRVPIGSYETKRQVSIDRDTIKRLDVNLEQNEAYIEIKALRQIIKKRKVMENVEGKMVEVERDITHFEEVGGVMIEINNDPALTKVTITGEAVGYYLPQGSYRILASYEDLGAAHMLHVTDTSPQQIDLRLMPRREVKLPELPVPPSPGASQAIDTRSLPRPGAAPGPAVAPAPAAPAPRPGVAASSKLAPEPIELAEDILEGPAPIMLDNSPVVGDSTQIPIDIDDLFTAQSEVPVSEMMGLGDSPLSDNEKQESIRRARQMQASGRFEEAAELFLRAGQLDEAAEMCQKSGNQALNYKIYGISYLRNGQHREAAEMFKYADEPLLEAEALEGLRLFDEANRKRGSYFEQRGDWSRALKHYQKASAFDRIGELHERMQNHEQAAEAFFRARLFDRAGMSFELAENTKRAAEAYEMDGNFEKAAELFRKLGSNVKVFNLLEKSGRYFEAAEGYKKFGLLDEAIHACQQVPPNSPDYLRAALIMGKIFIEKEEIHLARSVYFKVVSSAEIDPTNIERHYEFAVLIQEQGMIHEAYTLFERLQTVRYNYADVTIRLQHLADQIERERAQHGTAPPPGTVPPFPGFRSSTSGLSSTNFATPTPTARQTPSSNRYVFERELGRGAMGIVYMARDTALDRAVAYKTVSNAIKDNPASLKYFLSEAKSLAALNHQNVVTVYDVGQEESNYYITMEFVDGRSLGEFIREKGRLSLKNVVVIATKICAGLEYAHSRSVIHRDIKPSNIMISNQGDVKIMDFGLAKIMNDAVQDRTIVRGTPLYMAPEQVEGVGVDHRSDIYSFGVTLFEMATGTLPFTKGDIAYHHLHTPPPSPIRYNPSIPEGLEKVILKCLEKKKEARYQRVADIKRELAPLRSVIARS